MINIMPEMDIALFFHYKQSAKEIIAVFLVLCFSLCFVTSFTIYLEYWYAAKSYKQHQAVHLDKRKLCEGL